MSEAVKHAKLNWRERRVPVATQFDDPYFSVENGLAETRHVFLAGNGLPERFVDGFRIGELGFGSGLNLLVAWAAWEAMGCAGPLRFTSFEAYPMQAHDMARAHATWPELQDYSERFLAHFDGARFACDTLELSVIGGDVRDSLPVWQGNADAWFLDGFSPAKNPQMWEPAVMQAVGDHTAQGGTVATYTAAGHVRRGLEAAGFAIERQAGFGRKRHMTVGRFEGAEQ